MNIRHATRDDAEAIAKIHIQAWRSGYQKIMPDEYLQSLSVTTRTKQWLTALSEPGPGINRVIELEGILSGFCVYGPARDKDLSNENAGELVAINIAPRYWGKGLATELINHVLATASHHRWSSLYLWVIKENLRARSLYESMGFEYEGNEKISSELTGCQLHELRYVNHLMNRIDA